MQGLRKWLSLGKLRVGYGILGNNRIDVLSRYTYLTFGYNYPYGLGHHTLQNGATATALGNDGINGRGARASISQPTSDCSTTG